MKHLFIPTLSLLLFACSKPKEETVIEAPAAEESAALAETLPASQSVEETASKKVNYLPVLLKTVESTEDIAELEKRLNAIQPINDQYNALLAQIRSETIPEKLDELKSALQPIEQDFKAQNVQLIEQYGIDLNSTNEYLLIKQKTDIFVQLDEGSADSADEGYVLTKTLEGSELVEQFENDLQQVAQVGEYIAHLKQVLATTTEEAAQAGITTELAEAQKLFIESNKILFDTYGYTFERPSKIRHTKLGIYSQPALPRLNEIPGMPNDFIYIGALEGVDANLEFERNLRIMQTNKERAKSLVENISAEADGAKKAEIQKEFDALIAQLDEDNKTMVEAYKYSIERDYSQIVTKARLYIKLTEAEIAAQKAKNEDYTAPENGFEPIITINGVDQNLAFQRDTEMIRVLRENIVQARQAFEAETDEAKKAQIQEFMQQAIERITAANKAMIETYKYSLNREYEYVVENSDIYLQLTREEISEL
ncbi:MAG: hypothetical protein ACSHYA_14850 [Opitutaceae bacterium]